MNDQSTNRSRRVFLQAAAGAAAMSLAAGDAAAAERKPKGRIKQSLCWGCFAHGVEPKLLIAEAAKTGYKSIEMGPRKHWQAIIDAGMTIAIFGGHGSLGSGLNDPRNHGRIERELKDNIALAHKMKIPSLITFSGNRNKLSDEEGIRNCAAGLKRVTKDAEQAGVNLAMELLNSKVNHPGYQCDHTKWGVEMCMRCESPAATLLYDIYHMQIMEGDLIRTIRDNIKYIKHFHTAGNPDRRDPDETQEIYYPPIMQAIVKTGYQGYVGHEFRPRGNSIEALKKYFPVFDV